MTSKLEQLKTLSIVVADSGNIEAIARFKPRDCTTNPSLILQAASMPQYAHIVQESLEWATKAGKPLEAALDKLTVRFGAELTRLVPGDVSTEVDARLSFDSDAMVNKALELLELYKEEGVGKERILIKLASTWEGVQAARVLEAQGVRCNLTLVFSLEQAVACAQAGAFLISPFVGRITDWYKKARGVDGFTIPKDPGVQSLREIYAHFKAHGYKTVVMGASFRSAAQVEALAGCDRLTVSPALLGELEADNGPLERALVAEVGQQVEATLSEKDFRWALTENTMAGEKLSEGIRQFNADSVKLRALLETLSKAPVAG